jgi:hypothetical protein
MTIPVVQDTIKAVTDTVSSAVNVATDTVSNVVQAVSDTANNIGTTVSNAVDDAGQSVSDLANDIGTAVVEHPLQTAALVTAAFVAPELIAAMGSEAAAAEAAVGLSEAEQLTLANQIAAESQLGGVAGSSAIGAEALPAVTAPVAAETIEAPIETASSAPSAPTNAPIEAPPPAEPITAPVESTPAPSTPVETVDTGPFVQSDNGLYTLPEEAVSTAPTTDLPEPPEEWTPPENLPPADTPTGIDAEGAQPPISTDQTDEIYKKLDNVKKQIANDLVKKGIPLSNAVKYANGLGQTASQPTQVIQQPQQTTSGGSALSPLSAQYLTSTASKQGFVNPLSSFEKIIAADTKPQPTPTQSTVQVSQGNVMPDYYSYGQNQSIDDILGITAKEGGLVTPLMAKGGSVQKYAEGGLSVPLMNHGGKMRGDFRHGAHVAGPGDGQSDDIPAMLADGEFVFSADVVSALGNGSTKAGSDKLYEMMHAIRARARSKGPKDLPPPALKSPLDYLSKKSRS